MINIYNKDCLKALKEMQDNQFDLAIVDPPYGKKPTRDNKGTGGFNNSKNYDNKANLWDIKPSKEYFIELQRVSKNQIIWGANYFIEHLKSSNAFICWNKKNGDNIFADFELAYTSFTSRARIYTLVREMGVRFHPTQKPVKLYEWLLMNYAKEGDKILDTHLGSGSIALACHNLGYDLEGYELDKEYYDNALKRLKQHQAQTTLF
tara:strand:+ start:375 stop:992 length:618 start_codon:yes stop_codon:yes gene_type:complete